MKKLKTFLKFALAGLVILTLAAVIVPRFVDARAFVPAISGMVKDHTGRDIYFNGPITLRLFPWLRVDASDIVLSNAPGFKPENMAYIGKLSAGIKVLPLIRRQLEISAVNFNDVEFYYGVNGEGVNNLKDMFQKMESHASVRQQEASAQQEKSSFSLAKTSISEVNVLNGRINYDDAQTDRHVSIAPINLTTSQVASGVPIKVRLSATTTGTSPKFQTDLNFNTVVTAGSNGIKLEALTGTVSYEAAGNAVSMDVHTDLEIDTENSVIKTSGLSVDTSAKLSGGNAKLNAGADLIYDIKNARFEATNIALTSYDMTALGHIRADNLTGSPVLEGALASNKFSLRSFFERLRLDKLTDTRDPEAYSRASFSVKFDIAEKKLAMPIYMTLDNSSLSANVTADMSGKKPAFTVPLTVDSITLDSYLPVAKVETGPVLPPSEKRRQVEITLPQIDLSAYPDVELKMHIGSFLVNNAAIGNFNMAAGLQNSTISLQSLSAAFFGGNLSAEGKLVGQKNMPIQANLSARMTETNLEDALAVFAPQLNKEGLPKRGSFIVQASLKDNIAKLTNSEFKLDEVILKADVEADLTKKLSVRANMSINDVVLDNYLVSSGKTEDKPDTQLARAPELAPIMPSPSLLPLDTLTDVGVNVVGDLKINSITYRNVTVRSIKSRLLMRDGVARLSPTTASFYKGNMQADITVRKTGLDDFTNYITLSLTSVSAGEMISALGKTRNPFLTGTFSAYMDMSAKGLLIHDILATLNGNMSYSINDGVIQGFAFNPDLFTSDMLGYRGEGKTTPIQPVRGSGTIAEGVLDIAPLWVRADYMSASLQGGLGFADQSLNFNGNLRLSDARVPFDIKGSFTHPEFNLNESDLRNKLIVELTKKTGKGLIRTPIKILEGISGIVEKGLDSMMPEEF